MKCFKIIECNNISFDIRYYGVKLPIDTIYFGTNGDAEKHFMGIEHSAKLNTFFITGGSYARKFKIVGIDDIR